MINPVESERAQARRINILCRILACIAARIKAAHKSDGIRFDITDGRIIFPVAVLAQQILRVRVLAGNLWLVESVFVGAA